MAAGNQEMGIGNALTKSTGLPLLSTFRQFPISQFPVTARGQSLKALGYLPALASVVDVFAGRVNGHNYGQSFDREASYGFRAEIFEVYQFH